MGANKKHFVYTDNTATKEAPDIKEHGERLLRQLDTPKEVVASNKPIKFKPAPNKVLVEQMKEEIQSSIIIPDAFKKLTNKGIVVKLGLETPDKPQIWKLGQILYFPTTATIIPVEEDSRTFRCINQFDAWGYEE